MPESGFPFWDPLVKAAQRKKWKLDVEFGCPPPIIPTILTAMHALREPEQCSAMILSSIQAFLRRGCLGHFPPPPRLALLAYRKFMQGPEGRIYMAR